MRNTISYINEQLYNTLVASKEILGGCSQEISNCLDNAINKLNAPIQLAIIGKISSSKSTLVNAILGASNIVATGKAELTYNVNWLKYGSLDDDIKIVFKDLTYDIKPRKEWKRLANRLSDEEAIENEDLKQYIDKIKYIEVPYPSEILKYVNIIDTPGLYSYYRKDSENTISFLKEVKPDAVIMLFTKSILSEDMETLSKFQEKASETQRLFNLNPLNAIGMLAKMDECWKISEKKNPYSVCRRVIEDLKRENPILNTTFFEIQPISAMLALTSTFVKEDFSLLSNLAKLDDDNIENMFKSKRHFLAGAGCITLTQEELKQLIGHYGLYGLYAIVTFFKQHNSCLPEDLALYLEQLSGFKQFRKILLAHFRDRAVLIKTQNYVSEIIHTCEKVRNATNDILTKELIDKVQIKIMTMLMSIHEYAEWHYLAKIYNGDFNHLEKNMVEEYKMICGENGNSVIDKLSLDPKSNVQDMRAKASERASYWNIQYNVARIRKPKDAELCKVMSESYKVLGQRIDEMAQKEKEAKEILNMAHAFFYGE